MKSVTISFKKVRMYERNDVSIQQFFRAWIYCGTSTLTLECMNIEIFEMCVIKKKISIKSLNLLIQKFYKI